MKTSLKNARSPETTGGGQIRVGTRVTDTMGIPDIDWVCFMSSGNNGRGQPLSFTLSFGETPWFDEEGEIRRCDWLERNP